MNSANQMAPHEDYGFFGPDSVAWKVFGYPTTLTVGFQRTVVTEMFEPFLLASVNDTGAVMTRPELRYDRTLQYMATIVFHDSRSVLKASDTLVKIHKHVVGTEPISGLPYDANDPAAQLWIHLTAWHSVLYTYEKFGPGKLTPAEETQYWAECARAATFQTIDIDDVPRSREQMRAYFERMRPLLAATEATQIHVDHLLNPDLPGNPLPAPLRPLEKGMEVLFRSATIATLPQWMRKMAGVKQSPVTDVVVTNVMKFGMRLIAVNPKVMSLVVRQMSPLTAPVVGPILQNITPNNPVVRTPGEARSEYGIPTPAERYAEIKQDRAGHALPAHAARDGAEPLLAFDGV